MKKVLLMHISKLNSVMLVKMEYILYLVNLDTIGTYSNWTVKETPEATIE